MRYMDCAGFSDHRLVRTIDLDRNGDLNRVLRRHVLGYIEFIVGPRRRSGSSLERHIYRNRAVQLQHNRRLL
jgi:hypothetical protein